MKIHLLIAATSLTIFVYQQNKDKILENIVSNGVTEKVRIIDKTEDCVNSTRNRNKIKVETSKHTIFSLSVSYAECSSLKTNDSVLIRYLDGHNEVLRVYDYNIPDRKKDYPHYVFLIISVIAILSAVIKHIKNKA